MKDLINFQGKTRRIVIPAEIGRNYKFVGIALLDDELGDKVFNIYHANKEDLAFTNLEILR